ncbi:fasciclin domain-containing protein [Phragmitibacter flavus]|nr:fasciclin domain-containing protein [Phragmitibacter flavus]
MNSFSNKTPHNMIKKLITLSVVALSFGGMAFAADDIVDTAKSAGVFKTLTAALDAADKTSMLKEEGPYTVFAPSDEAFAKLPAGTVEDLLKPENKEKLGKILAYHVLAGKVMAADVKTMMAKTANGAELDIKVSDAGVMVNNAKVVQADVKASNGVIHVIDAVLLPPAN